MGKFDVQPVPGRIKNFENGFYWVKFWDCVEWEPAWVQLDTIHGGLRAMTTAGHHSRPLEPQRDEIGYKIVREAPIVIPETKQLAEDAEFLLSLTPPWARHCDPHMHPTAYGTGSYQKDSDIVDRVKKIKESIEVTLHGKAKEKG